MFQLSSPPSQIEQQMLSQFEVQRSICSQYIKMAAGQLHLRQAQLLSTANDLLQQISVRDRVKDLSEWDVFSTRDSMVIEDQGGFNLSAISQHSKGRLIQRKCAHISRNAKENEESLNQCLGEVEKECSNKTNVTVKKVVEQYRKLKARLFQLEKKEKGARSKQKLIEQLQEKNIMLNSRIEDIQRELAKIRSDYAGLKTSNNDLMEQSRKKQQEIDSERKIKLYEEYISHQQSNGKKQLTNNMPYDVLNDLMEQKERLLNLRQSQVKAIESKVQKQLLSEQSRCVSCCQMLKKIKGSIIAYKKYLEHQGASFEEIVDKFKEKLLDQCLTSN